MAGGTDFSRFVIKRRKHLGLTQEKLAELIGVSKSAIAKWETDGGLPDRDNLRKLAEAIEVSVDELHRVIAREDISEQGVNITLDVVTALESYGYRVIRPGERKEEA